MGQKMTHTGVLVLIMAKTDLRLLKGRCYGNSIKVAKSAFFADQSSLSRSHSETDWNIETRMDSLEAH